MESFHARKFLQILLIIIALIQAPAIQLRVYQTHNLFCERRYTAIIQFYMKLLKFRLKVYLLNMLFLLGYRHSLEEFIFLARLIIHI